MVALNRYVWFRFFYPFSFLTDSYDSSNDSDSTDENEKASNGDDLDESKTNSNSFDEYEDNDTSDEEDIRNTVGNVPKNWYDEYKHLGYDWDGKRIMKAAQGDRLDEFLKRVEDPDFWRTVKDPQTGQDVVLSDEDVNLIKRINGQRLPDANFDDYAVSVTCVPRVWQLKVLVNFKQNHQQMALSTRLIFNVSHVKLVTFASYLKSQSRKNQRVPSQSLE